jgi:hypothetical protein
MIFTQILAIKKKRPLTRLKICGELGQTLSYSASGRLGFHDIPAGSSNHLLIGLEIEAF